MRGDVPSMKKSVSVPFPFHSFPKTMCSNEAFQNADDPNIITENSERIHNAPIHTTESENRVTRQDTATGRNISFSFSKLMRRTRTYQIRKKSTMQHQRSKASTKRSSTSDSVHQDLAVAARRRRRDQPRDERHRVPPSTPTRTDAGRPKLAR